MHPFASFSAYVRTLLLLNHDRRRAALFPPTLVEKPTGTRVLVLSPHFDDEVIGCGGTLIKHVKNGDAVSVVYLTDGTNGTPDITDKKEGARIRKQESETAMRLLGIKNLYFLSEIESDLNTQRETATHLKHILTDTQPDVVYLPWFGENHSDHQKMNRIFLGIANDIVPHCNIAAYEVWTPLPPTIVVDIGSVFDKKMEALECFTSQLKHNNYRRVVSGLNAYNSRYCLNGGSYAEAFLYMSLFDYHTLYKNLR